MRNFATHQIGSFKLEDVSLNKYLFARIINVYLGPSRGLASTFTEYSH